ncbi:16605_t:CDS:2, partial [Racocetra fulgida]
KTSLWGFKLITYKVKVRMNMNLHEHVQTNESRHERIMRKVCMNISSKSLRERIPSESLRERIPSESLRERIPSEIDCFLVDKICIDLRAKKACFL